MDFMTAADKDTIYIDIDDEITGIIDKLIGSKGKVAALVLPKRAAVFQSSVNMKLLKRAADANKKHLVLITSEAGLLPLAGAAGVHVAKTLTSKPEIPVAPQAFDDGEESIQEDGTETDTLADPNATIGQLAGPAAATIGADGIETLALDDEAPAPELDTPVPKTFDPPSKKKNKKFAVPNFERFRLLLVLGGLLLILLIGGVIFAAKALPKATISIKTDATSVDTSVPLILSTAAKAVEPATNTVPAKLASLPKTFTQQVPTTGQKNNGNKASGSVTVTNCNDDPYPIPAGTGFSSGGNTYISQESATVPGSTFTSTKVCHKEGKASISILAQNGGVAYNLPSGANFTIAGSPSGLSAQGNTVSGGSDSIVQTVNQNDITSAKAKIVLNEAEAKQALNSQLQKDNYYPIAATYVAGPPAVNTSAEVGEVANTVTVTEVITYTTFGVHKNDLRTLQENDIKTQIDTQKQTILNNGLDGAVFAVDTVTPTAAKLTMTGRATAGPDLNVDMIKSRAAGQKPGALRAQLQNNPDVTSVDIKLSPFWVNAIPKKSSRIIVDIAKPTATTKASSPNDTQP